jgi:hypothetical protein
VALSIPSPKTVAYLARTFWPDAHRVHFTPTSGSWLNMVEIFFGIITRQAICRGSFGSVREFVDAITTFINGGNDAANHSPGPRTPTRSHQSPP